ncbi:MAG: glycosyltransferase [Roseburia sp.]|nr:glycosyltransferase [Roseburia sp.]MCM1278129.1 glycosyltransferase [Robinsoniella sp.]
MPMKVSIIVPVFNSEDSLSACIDSLVNQTLEDMEILFINDGSTDNSLQILESYQKQYPDKIKIFSQENQGQGPARNLGISKACGTYIGFVDSDDYVELNTYELMYNEIQKLDCDIAVAQYYKVSKDGKETIHCRLPFMIETLYSGADYLKDCGGMFAIWNKLYKKSFIENFTFPSIWFEDVAWTGIVMSHNPSLCYIDKPFYHYIRKEGSTVSSVRNLKTLEDSLQAAKIALKDSLPESQPVIAYSYAKLLIFQARRRPMYATEYYKLIHEMRASLTASPYYQEDLLLQKQTQAIVADDWSTIPYHVFYDDFGKTNHSKRSLPNKESWETLLFSPIADFTCLDESNCNLDEFPIIKAAYEVGNYKLAGHYFKCRSILEHGGIGISQILVGIKNMTPLLAKSMAIFSFLTPDAINPCFYASTASHPVMEELIAAIEASASRNPKITFQEILSDFFLEKQKLVYSRSIEIDFKQRFISCYQDTVRIYSSSAFTYSYGIAPTFAKIDEAALFSDPELSENSPERIKSFYYETLQQTIPAYTDYKADTEAGTAAKPLMIELRATKKQRRQLAKRLKDFNDLPLYKKIHHILKYKKI